MVNTQTPQTNDEEKYISENQVVAEFDTLGSFWRVQGHLRRPYVMPIGTVLNVFINGVKPLWEDPACKEGGRFSLRMPKTHTAKYWEDLLLAMIGEQFTTPNEILGLVLSTKYNGDSIAVWHRHCD